MIETVFGFLLLAAFVLFIIFESCDYSTYGFFVNKEISELYMNLNESDMWINSVDSEILMINGGEYISRHNGISSRYYINNFGVVPRWSKLHKKIEQYYIEQLKKQMGKK